MEKNKKCIVFGANGYIGKHLVFFLEKLGYHVIASGRQNINNINNFIEVDISDKNQLLNFDWDVDFVFVFAGITGTFNGFDNFEKFNQVNEINLLNILNAIRNSSYRPLVIFPSSRLVYQGKDYPLKEDDLKEAKTIYAANKIACEFLLKAYQNAFDIDFTIFRICVPYGNLLGIEYSYGTTGFFIKQAKTNKVINLYGDGSLRRTFTHIEDICNQIVNTISSPASKGETYNIGGEDLSLSEVANLIATKYKAKINYIPWPEMDLKLESGSTVFNSEKIKSNTIYKLKHSFLEWVVNI